jgi:hypothetical protein
VPGAIAVEVAIDDQRVTLEAKEVLQDASQLSIAIGQARFKASASLAMRSSRMPSGLATTVWQTLAIAALVCAAVGDASRFRLTRHAIPKAGRKTTGAKSGDRSWRGDGGGSGAGMQKHSLCGAQALQGVRAEGRQAAKKASKAFFPLRAGETLVVNPLCSL